MATIGTVGRVNNPIFEELKKKFQIVDAKRDPREIAASLGITLDQDVMTKQAQDAVLGAYNVAQQEYQNTSDNYYQNTLQNYASVLDAIRKAGAAGELNNQNTGTNWLQELTAALALAQQGATSATENAQQGYSIADKLAADLAAATNAARTEYNTLAKDIEGLGLTQYEQDMNGYIAELSYQAALAGLGAGGGYGGGYGGYGGGSYGGGGYGGDYGGGTNLYSVTEDSVPPYYRQIIVDRANAEQWDEATFQAKYGAATIMDYRHAGVEPSSKLMTDLESVRADETPEESFSNTFKDTADIIGKHIAYYERTPEGYAIKQPIKVNFDNYIDPDDLPYTVNFDGLTYLKSLDDKTYEEMRKAYVIAGNKATGSGADTKQPSFIAEDRNKYPGLANTGVVKTGVPNGPHDYKGSTTTNFLDKLFFPTGDKTQVNNTPNGTGTPYRGVQNIGQYTTTPETAYQRAERLKASNMSKYGTPWKTTVNGQAAKATTGNATANAIKAMTDGLKQQATQKTNPVVTHAQAQQAGYQAEQARIIEQQKQQQQQQQQKIREQQERMRAQAEAQARAQAERIAQIAAQKQAEAQRIAQAQAQAQARALAQAKAQAQAQAKARAKAQAQAQAKARAKAQAQAEASARAQAERIAQIAAQNKAKTPVVSKETANKYYYMPTSAMNQKLQNR